MPLSPRKSIKEQAFMSLTASPPCVSWLKGVLCSHLRSLWMMLMVLTVVCVAIQIIGVVKQSRNGGKLLSDRLLNLRLTSDVVHRPPPTFHKDGEPLHPEPVYQEELKSAGWERRIPRTEEHTKEDEVQLVVVEKLEEVLEFDGYPKSSNNVLSQYDESQSKVNDPLTEASKVRAGKMVLSVDAPHGDKLDTGLKGSADLRHEGLKFHKTGKALSAAADPRRSSILSRPSSSNARLLDHGVNSAAPVKPSTCQPKKHLVFLKTHKTASSTILNILYRYGDSNNLTFALPLNKHSQLFYPYYFASHFVEGIRNRSVSEFHIMCNHMRFRKAEVEKVMPPDTFYFSILRHPVAMLESIYIYYKSIPAFAKTRSLDDFLSNATRLFNASQAINNYAHNLLTFDFGFDNNATADSPDLEERASAAIAAIERDFNLVMISEYFDESMILLRHALCWSLDDVVSFKLNSRNERTRRTLSPESADKIKSWNALDWRLYVHFNTTFWRRVDTVLGREEMRREISLLQERRAQLAKTCLKDGAAVDPSKIKDAGLKPFQYGQAVIQGYNLNPGLDGPTRTQCQNLITPELQYTDALYSKQFPVLAARLKQAAKKKVTSQRLSGSNRTAMMGVGQAWVREPRYRRTVWHKELNIPNQKSLFNENSNNRNMP